MYACIYQMIWLRKLYTELVPTTKDLLRTALYSAATFLNIAIAYYGSADGHSMYNCLVLPLRRTGGTRGVNKLIHILWVNRYHYVQLLMNDDSSPLPLVQQNWRAAPNNSCKDLEIQYHNRKLLWNDCATYNDNKITPPKTRSI